MSGRHDVASEYHRIFSRRQQRHTKNAFGGACHRARDMPRVVDYEHLGIGYDMVRRVKDNARDRTSSRGLTEANARQQKDCDYGGETIMSQ